MEYRTEKQIVGDDGTILKAGDRVSIDFKSGCGFGSATITKITDTGFHANCGGRRDKSIQFSDVERIEKWND